MKKCSYCGKEYPDDALHCVIDGEPLPNGEAASSTTPPPIPEWARATAAPAGILSEPHMRIAEVALVCLIAFGGSILLSTYYLTYGPPSGTDRGAFAWLVQGLREVSALGLLWYVLTRRKKTLSDLGLKWKWSDAGWAVLLVIAGTTAFYAVYDAIYFSGLTQTSQSDAGAHVGNLLFGGAASVAMILFQFLNPFFEELIVRAYLMTEIKQLTNSMAKAIIASTLIQTSYHFYQGAPSAFADGAMFLVFSIYYAKTSRITPVILAHLCFDVGGLLWYWARR